MIFHFAFLEITELAKEEFRIGRVFLDPGQFVSQFDMFAPQRGQRLLQASFVRPLGYQLAKPLIAEQAKEN